MDELNKDYKKAKETGGGILLVLLFLFFLLYALVIEAIIFTFLIYLIFIVFTEKIKFTNILKIVSPLVFSSVLPIQYYTDSVTISELLYYEFEIHKFLGYEPIGSFWLPFWGLYFFVGSIVALIIFGGIYDGWIDEQDFSVKLRHNLFQDELIDGLKLGMQIGAIQWFIAFMYILYTSS